MVHTVKSTSNAGLLSVMTSSIWLQLLLASLAAEMVSSSASLKEATEYCDTESFRPRCQSADEVIMITEALYGIPSLGRCHQDVDSTLKHNGCQSDVKEYLSSRCSGRRECDVRVADTVMGQLAPNCSRGYTSSLNASYTCVKVGTGCRSCSASGYARLPTSLSSGFIASIVTSESADLHGGGQDEACGALHCPWLLHVQPGLIINLTLYDYAPWNPPTPAPQTSPVPVLPAAASGGGSGQHQLPRPRYNSAVGSLGGSITEHCNSRYAIIKERANPKDTVICGRREPRERHIYTSISNTLEVYIVGPSAHSSHFLIRYEAIGCPDIIPPKYSRMRRKEDIVDIDCPADGQKWTLRCVGNKWEGEGSLGVCAPEVYAVAPLNPSQKSSVTPAAAMDGGSVTSGELSFTGFWNTLKALPFGILITLVIAIAVIIIVVIVTSGIFCLKKRQYDEKHKTPAANDIYSQKCSEFEFRQDLDGAAAYLVPKGIAQTLPSKHRRSIESDLLMNDNTYGGSGGGQAGGDGNRWEGRPLPSIPRSGTDRSRRSADFQNSPHAGSFVRANYPPDGAYPNGSYPNGGYPNGGYPKNGVYPNGSYPAGCYPNGNCCGPNRGCYPPGTGVNPQHSGGYPHPNYPCNVQHPNHFMTYQGNPSFGNRPYYPAGSSSGNFNPNYPGQQFGGGGNSNLVTVQMHRADSARIQDPQVQRRAAPQGRAAVVYRGTGPPPDRTSTQSGENTYFVLDADAVADEPPAQLGNPMSLPRTQQRNHTGNVLDRFPSNERNTAMDGNIYAETVAELDTPLLTADGKFVEDVILNPAECPGTNGKFFVATSPVKISPMTMSSNSDSYGLDLDRPLYLGKGADYPTAADIERGGSEERWPAPPSEMDLTANSQEPLLSSSPEHPHSGENNSLEITLRPSRDHQGQDHTRTVIPVPCGSGVDGGDVSASSNNYIGSFA